MAALYLINDFSPVPICTQVVQFSSRQDGTYALGLKSPELCVSSRLS